MPIAATRGDLSGAGRRFGIVASRFNSRIVEALVASAIDCLRRHGVDAAHIRLVTVPGAWEIPQALEELAKGGEVDALVALGALIRGETAHFDFLAAECSGGAARVAERHHLPVAFGVLTCETSEQAQERAGGKLGNKGWEAALAALEMANLFARLRG
ncbi:MAG TPA: 6,7-dimethyl-8-ribityllumazine synthase [Thermoanaerobaculia bacterium]|nr:6,7-dimethyl-8-ribityllumazine synthase [Thermoanaerobaculia bacterium]